LDRPAGERASECPIAAGGRGSTPDGLFARNGPPRRLDL